MRPALIPVCWALTAALAAADGNPSLAPDPRSAPLAPQPADTSNLTADERLQRQLEAAVRQRDESIQGILRTHAGLRPVASGSLGAGLERPAHDRDLALADLRAALDDYLGRTHRGGKDLLDTAGASRQSVQLPPLSAANHLAIASCLQELAGTGSSSEREKTLTEGLGEIEAVGNDAPDELKSRTVYLRVWFLSELARLPGDAAVRADQSARARATGADFISTWPDSELAAAVSTLIADLAPKP